MNISNSKNIYQRLNDQRQNPEHHDPIPQTMPNKKIARPAKYPHLIPLITFCLL